MTALPEVRAGQVWADNDRREVGRTLRVDVVGETHATCTVLTVAPGKDRRTIGKTREIALKRFRPTSTGYTLQEDLS